MILVTGAGGFLGGALVKHLSEQGKSVRALVRDPNRAGYIRDLPNVQIVSGDLTQSESLKSAVNGCQIVIHSAAALSGEINKQLAVNRDGTRELALAAAAAGVERFVHVSTIGVYGYGNRQDVTEKTPPDPGHDAYGISKLAGELALKQVSVEHGLKYTVIRPGMIYGARSGMWTAQMFKVARRKPTIFVGSGAGSCYPIHVEDVVDLILVMMEHRAAVGEIFNCTPDPSPTWRDFLGGYARLAGHNSWLGIPPVLLKPVAWLVSKFVSGGSPVKDLPTMLAFSQCYITYKTTKAQQMLGWQPKISLSDGIAGCADWLREKKLL